MIASFCLNRQLESSDLVSVADMAIEDHSAQTHWQRIKGNDPLAPNDSSSSIPCVRIDIPETHDPHVDALLRPLPQKEGTLRCRVRRLDRNKLEMYLETGHVFVLSAVRSGSDWLIMDRQQSSDVVALRHIARLRSHKDSTFTCVRSRYEKSSTVRELLYIRHATKEMAEHLPQLNTMQGGLALPSPDGSNNDAPAGELAMQTRLAMGEGKRAPESLAVVTSKLPKWNSRSQTYELPFSGRANFASARNFQLVEHAAMQRERVVLLYGKIEEDEFALDFAFPLSLLHAFSICITTFAW